MILSVCGEGSAAISRITDRDTAISHAYQGCRTREWLHMDYVFTLALHTDKSSTLLMGKLKPRERNCPSLRPRTRLEPRSPKL